MADFRSFKTARRLPAEPMQPVVDPAGWAPEPVEECALDIDFERGDIQFLNNFVMLHTRREYEDWPEPARKRHLLRLWLHDPRGRPIPQEQREGRAGRGVNIAGVKRIAPLDVEVAA